MEAAAPAPVRGCRTRPRSVLRGPHSGRAEAAGCVLPTCLSLCCRMRLQPRCASSSCHAARAWQRWRSALYRGGAGSRPGEGMAILRPNTGGASRSSTRGRRLARAPQRSAARGGGPEAAATTSSSAAASAPSAAATSASSAWKRAAAAAAPSSAFSRARNTAYASWPRADRRVRPRRSPASHPVGHVRPDMHRHVDHAPKLQVSLQTRQPLHLHVHLTPVMPAV
jgi:hypothetical protein